MYYVLRLIYKFTLQDAGHKINLVAQIRSFWPHFAYPLRTFFVYNVSKYTYTYYKEFTMDQNTSGKEGSVVLCRQNISEIMNIAVIDDVLQCRNDLSRDILQFAKQYYAGEAMTIDTFENGTDFLEQFNTEAYDMIFIDQYMDGLSGIETACAVREKDDLAAIIFVTSSREYAVESYTVRACGYLVKPYTYDAFVKAMQQANIGKIRNGRFINAAGEKILLGEILWCDRDDYYVRIQTENRGILRLRLSFAELELLLSPYPQFLSCYRGCLINMDKAEYIEALNFVMVNDDRVPFRKRDRKAIEKKYNDYLFQRIREDILV